MSSFHAVRGSRPGWHYLAVRQDQRHQDEACTCARCCESRNPDDWRRCRRHESGRGDLSIDRGEITRYTRTAMNPNGQPGKKASPRCDGRDIDALLGDGSRRWPVAVRRIGILRGLVRLIRTPVGVVLNPPNVPCWRNFSTGGRRSLAATVAPLRSTTMPTPPRLAEGLWGAGRGLSKTFSTPASATGIGTGILFDGRIYYGRTGAAAEGGHVSIDYNGPACGCGKRGCIEVLASGHGDRQKKARARLAERKAGCSPAMLELAGGDRSAVTRRNRGTGLRVGRSELRRRSCWKRFAVLAVLAGKHRGLVGTRRHDPGRRRCHDVESVFSMKSADACQRGA